MLACRSHEVAKPWSAFKTSSPSTRPIARPCPRPWRCALGPQPLYRPT
jgi:hypothetical protein